jgi:DNA-binding transcriptional regulator LsrR (DeoR family)
MNTSENIKSFNELVSASTLAKHLGVSRMLINKLKRANVLDIIKIDTYELFHKVESIIKFREYYKNKYPNSVINTINENNKLNS